MSQPDPLERDHQFEARFLRRRVYLGESISRLYGKRCREVVGSNRLWRRGQVWLTGIEIDRDRDVFVDHQPIAVDLLVNVGHAYGQIQLLALLIGASDALDAVAVGKRPPSRCSSHGCWMLTRNVAHRSACSFR